MNSLAQVKILISGEPASKLSDLGKRSEPRENARARDLCPSRPLRSLVRSRETCFTRPNRRACSQANFREISCSKPLGIHKNGLQTDSTVFYFSSRCFDNVFQRPYRYFSIA